MIRIDREDFDRLRKAGLIKFKTQSSAPNFYICNKEHKGKSKTYYVVEDYKILRFLGRMPITEKKNNSNKNYKKPYNKNYKNNSNNKGGRD